MQTNANIEEVVGKKVAATKRTMFWQLYTLPWLILTAVLVTGIFIAAKSAKPATSASMSTNLLEIVERQRVEIAILRGAAMTNGYGMWLTEPNGSNQFVITGTKAVYTNDLRIDPKVFASYLLEMKEMTVAQAEGARRLSGVAEELIVVGGSLKNGIKGFEKLAKEAANVYTNMPEVREREEAGKRVVKTEGEGGYEPVPFGVTDWQLAKDVGYNLEVEMTKGISGLIEFEVERWDGKDKVALTDRLQKGSGLMIKRSFDGFKTYNGIRK